MHSKKARYSDKPKKVDFSKKIAKGKMLKKDDQEVKKNNIYKRSEKSNANEDEKKSSFRKSEKPSFAGKERKTTFKKTGNPGFARADKNSAFKKVHKKPFTESNDDGLIRLNKYIANAGICSRREADELIATGVVSVNGKIVTQLGTRVSPTDTIQFGGQTLRNEKLVYVLLNKPKDYITTTEDPEGRKTVMALIENACKERIYPVGRLDRATTGLLLFTNDGDLAKKLTHPKFGVKKIYHVELDNKLSKVDMDKIALGVELDDGFAKVDGIDYDEGGLDKRSIGIEIHSGKNRIVRRIFETLGYKVMKLDRVYFAGLTKKNLPRGKWRFLSPMEINLLKRIK